MTKRKKIILAIVSIFLLAALTTGTIIFFSIRRYKKKIATMQIGKIDLAKTRDGVYIGAESATWVAVKLAVSVTNNKIIKIKILMHKQGRGKKGEKIIKRVLDKQSLQVDVVSGATSSSKLILRAIEKALKKEK